MKRSEPGFLVSAALVVVVLAVAWCGRAAAEENAPLDLTDLELAGHTVAKPLEQAPIQLQGLVTLHAADGIGLGAQLSIGERLGLRASVAYTPQFFVVDEDPWDDKFAHFALSSAAQLNVDVFYLFGSSKKGVSLNYRYSTLLGHGAGLGYQSSFDFAGQRFAFSIPVTYYPAGSERVRRELGLHNHERVNFPFGPGLRYGVGLAWLF